MNPLQNFLSKYKNIKLPHKTIKKSVIKAIVSTIHIHIQEEEITIQKNNIKIKAPSVVKQEIKLHKKEILNEINKEASNTTINDIV